MNTILKYAIIALVPIAMVFLSYHKGYDSGFNEKSLEVAGGIIKSMNKNIVDFNLKRIEMEKEDIEFSKKLEDNKAIEKEVIKEVIKYVERKDRVVNSIDSEWVRIYNNSIATTGTDQTDSKK